MRNKQILSDNDITKFMVLLMVFVNIYRFYNMDIISNNEILIDDVD